MSKFEIISIVLAVVALWFALYRHISNRAKEIKEEFKEARKDSKQELEKTQSRVDWVGERLTNAEINWRERISAIETSLNLLHFGTSDKQPAYKVRVEEVESNE